jgi:hypothetical protein
MDHATANRNVYYQDLTALHANAVIINVINLVVSNCQDHLRYIILDKQYIL